eukprot:360318-Chlamydomonas_euryale.AAC.2
MLTRTCYSTRYKTDPHTHLLLQIRPCGRQLRHRRTGRSAHVHCVGRRAVRRRLGRANALVAARKLPPRRAARVVRRFFSTPQLRLQLRRQRDRSRPL